MGVDWTLAVLELNFDAFAIPITVTPAAGAAASGRGYFDSNKIDYYGVDNQVISDQRTELDIIEREFPVLPRQGDVINIAPNPTGAAPGDYEVIDSTTNGGGLTTLTLQKVETARP